jgi:hypothetical protein
MPARLRVRAGVAIRRIVTTQGRAAFLTRAQVDPTRMDLHTLLALMALGLFHCGDSADVDAGRCGHIRLLLAQDLVDEGDGDRALTDG